MTRYISEWPENTTVAWWNAGRGRLNIVIRLYNAWQREASVSGHHDTDKAREILSFVEEGRQTWAGPEVDGSFGWCVVLDEIQKLVLAEGWS